MGHHLGCPSLQNHSHLKAKVISHTDLTSLHATLGSTHLLASGSKGAISHSLTSGARPGLLTFRKASSKREGQMKESSLAHAQDIIKTPLMASSL